MVDQGVLHDGTLWNGRKRTGTYRFPHAFAAAAAAAIASPSTAEVDGDAMAFHASLSLRIASNVINEDIHKLRLFNF